MSRWVVLVFFFFFQAEDGIRDLTVTGVQTCALPISVLRQTILAHVQPHAGEGRRHDDGEEQEQHEGELPEGPLVLAGLVPHQPVGACEQWKHERSEEHTSELQSQSNLVCRLLLEKKK